MFIKNSKILVLAPHTDDGEIGCGATIHKLSQQGHQIYYVAFSSCSDSLPKEFPPDTLVREVKQATLILGVKPENLLINDFTVRRFAERRQDILEYLVNLKQKLQPDFVFSPSENDMHQDHATIANEAIRAFKDSTILAYEMPWNNLVFKAQCFIGLAEEDVQVKVNALKAYKSQQTRPYMTEEFVRALAHVRGASVRKRYAEAFDVVRVVLE